MYNRDPGFCHFSLKCVDFDFNTFSVIVTFYMYMYTHTLSNCKCTERSVFPKSFLPWQKSAFQLYSLDLAGLGCRLCMAMLEQQTLLYSRGFCSKMILLDAWEIIETSPALGDWKHNALLALVSL